MRLNIVYFHPIFWTYFTLFVVCFTYSLLSRIEYDAYRTDLEELNLGPRDANTLPKIEQSQHLFQAHKEKYDKMRNDVSVKLKFLEENKVNSVPFKVFLRTLKSP